MKAHACARPSASWLAGVISILLAAWLGACSDGGQQTVKCFTDHDCPTGQQCVAGHCQLPADEGIVTCRDIYDCPPGQYCDDGICRDIPDDPQPDEPDAGEEDGDGGIDGNDGDVQPDGDQGPDEDTRDFSRLNFSVAIRRGGTSGPANQCVHNVRPQANQGPVLGDIEAPAGHVLSGTFRDANGSGLPGATVSLLSDRPECLPEPASTDNGGNFAFYLPSGGPYDIQAVAADGRAGHAHVSNLSSSTTQDIQLPATVPLHGGPLCSDCANSVALDGWTVETWYHGQNKLAHAGVISDPDGFDVPLENGLHYDWIVSPPQGTLMPRHVVLEDTCHLGTDCIKNTEPERTWLQLRDGLNLSGQVTAGGTGSQQSLLTVVNDTDQRMKESVLSGTGGSYQMVLRLGVWNLTVFPASNAFGDGAMMFASPAMPISQDTTKDAPMAIGQTVEFAGRLVDGGGGPVTDAQVRLIVNTAPMVEGSYDWCDSNPVQTGADGSFSVNCNLAP